MLAAGPEFLGNARFGEPGEGDGLVSWTRIAVERDEKRHADRVLTLVSPVRRIVGRSVCCRKPLIDVGRLRIERKLEPHAQRVISVALERHRDGFAAQDATTQVAPRLTVRRLSQDQPELACAIGSDARRNEVHARDGHRRLYLAVEVVGKVCHASIVAGSSVSWPRLYSIDRGASDEWRRRHFGVTIAP